MSIHIVWVMPAPVGLKKTPGECEGLKIAGQDSGRRVREMRRGTPNAGSFEQDHLSGLCKHVSLKTIQVHTAGGVGSRPCDRVASRLKITIDQRSHLLSHDIEYFQLDRSSLSQAEPDLSGWVEGIRVILSQFIAKRHFIGSGRRYSEG